MRQEPYSHTNSKGVTYYLNEKEVTLRGGKVQVIRYFTKDIRPDTAIYELPEDLRIQENPRNGFLTVVRIEQKPDYSSCADDEDCDDCEDDMCAEKENTAAEAPQYETANTFRKLMGRDECDGYCCAPRCNADRSCCSSTVAEQLLEKLRKEEAKRSVPKPTMRRCLVEEIKSFAETEDGKTGDSNTLVVAYEYGEKSGIQAEFNEVTPPTTAIIREDRYVNFSGSTAQYNRLQLQAHIKNLQTILNTLV